MHDNEQREAARAASRARQLVDAHTTNAAMAYALVEAAAVITQIAEGLDDTLQAKALHYATRYRNLARQHRP